MAVYEITLGLATFLGNLISSYLLYATNYKTVYILVTLLAGFAFVYTFFFIPESIKGEKEVWPFFISLYYIGEKSNDITKINIPLYLMNLQNKSVHILNSNEFAIVHL